LEEKIDEMEKSGIYKIVCAISRAFYIGQFKRRIGIRYEDHLGYVENGLRNSAIAEHAIWEDHELGATTLIK
jgi:hypothetical protein